MPSVAGEYHPSSLELLGGRIQRWSTDTGSMSTWWTVQQREGIRAAASRKATQHALDQESGTTCSRPGKLHSMF